MNRKLPDITESVPELKDRLRSESVGYKKQSSPLYTFCKAGVQRIESKSLTIGVNRKTVGQWLDAYQAGGISGAIPLGDPPCFPIAGRT